MRETGFIFSVVGVLLLCLVPSGFSQDRRKKIETKYEGKTVKLRSSVNEFKRSYFEVSGKFCYFERTQSPLFRPELTDLVKITDVKFKNKKIEVELKNEAGEDGKITFYLDQETSTEFTEEELEQILQSAFGQDGISFDPYTGNTQSRLYHAWDSNHLPPEELRKGFKTREKAQAAGYKACPICFLETHKISHYTLERQLGAEMANMIKNYYSPADDEEAKERLKAAGIRVLNGWPSPLRGYRYSFELLEGEVARAFSCPTGMIFLTTVLFGAVESEEELEAILAHQIAHVERRHGYWVLRNTIDSIQFKELIRKLYLEEIKDEERLNLVELCSPIYSYAGSYLVAGYGIEAETEADYYARLYLAKRFQNGGNGLPLILTKLKCLGEVNKEFSPNLFMTGPYINQRIDSLKTIQVRPFEEEVVFQGIDRKGRILVELWFLRQRLSRGKLQLTLYIAPTANFPGSFHLLPKDEYDRELRLMVHTDRRNVDFLSLQQGEVKYGFNEEVVFQSEESKEFLTGRIQRIKLKIKGVATWQLAKNISKK